MLRFKMQNSLEVHKLDYLGGKLDQNMCNLLMSFQSSLLDWIYRRTALQSV